MDHPSFLMTYLFEALYIGSMIQTTEKLRNSAHNNYSHGLFWEAIADCMRAVTINPALPWTYLLMGRCHMAMNRVYDAAALLERSRALLPKVGCEKTRQTIDELLQIVNAKKEFDK